MGGRDFFGKMGVSRNQEGGLKSIETPSFILLLLVRLYYFALETNLHDLSEAGRADSPI